MASANVKAMVFRVIGDHVRHGICGGRKCAVIRHPWPLAFLEARGTCWPPIPRRDKSFAKGMQPDNLAAERDGLAEEGCVGGEGDAETGLQQIGGEVHDVGRVRDDRGDICHKIFGRYGCLVEVSELSEDPCVHVRFCGGCVGPERESASAAAAIVIEIWNTGREGCTWTAARRGSVERSQIDLSRRVRLPQRRVRAV